MKRTVIMALLALICCVVPGVSVAQTESNRKERNCITEGNKLYNQGNYREAIKRYQEALKQNPSSAVARYNLGLSQVVLGTNPADTTQAAKELAQKGVQEMEQVAKMGSEKPMLASRANYNLGNIAFNSEDYRNALNLYKQALRLNPADDNARRNLRITQLKLQDQDQDQDKDDKDRNQDQQDQDQQQNQQDQQDQKQNPEQPQQNQQEQNLNNQTADQILKAMENKENQTRARVSGQQGDKSNARNRNYKNW